MTAKNVDTFAELGKREIESRQEKLQMKQSAKTITMLIVICLVSIGCNQRRYQPAKWRSDAGDTTLPVDGSNGSAASLPSRTLPANQFGTMPGRTWGTMPGRTWGTLPRRNWNTLPGRTWNTTPNRDWSTMPNRYRGGTTLQGNQWSTVPSNRWSTNPTRIWSMPIDHQWSTLPSGRGSTLPSRR
ncbi:MAG: hypothetical protein AAF623_01305 [Planctomycetota bacterium]